ncbi:hypothetical protein LTR08_008790 [Meristemomyces frigidus]|nr:hypothetical protein LTR08_008790 [Meristemomyces frigidus]
MANSGIYESDYDSHSEAEEHAEASSDTASLYADADADSPSDGYFAQRAHPQHTFVAQQAPAQPDAEAKAREAAAERSQRSSSSTSSPPSQNLEASSTSSTPSPVWPRESTPLLDAGPPPPDYAAAIAHRSGATEGYRPVGNTLGAATADRAGAHAVYSPMGRSRPTSYGSIEPTPRSDDHAETQWPTAHPNRAFGGQPQPQSMRDAGRAADEETGLIDGRRKSTPSGRRPRRACCEFLTPVKLVLAALAVGIVLLVTLLSAAPRTDDPSPPSPSPPDNPSHLLPTHPPNTACAFTFFSDSLGFGFDSPTSFNLTEAIHAPATHLPGGISGNIAILPAPASQSVAISVRISYATTYPFHSNDMGYEYSKGVLRISYAEDAVGSGRSGYARQRACMDVAIAVYVRGDVELSDWTLASANLNVQVGEGLFRAEQGKKEEEEGDESGDGRDGDTNGLRISNTSLLQTSHGSINPSYWSSRHTTISTSSGSVTGTYALRDTLAISTTSGAINVNALPQAADPTDIQPAELVATTQSGSIHVALPVRDVALVPHREYRTRVASRSGSISGGYLHGSATSFATSSGSMKVDVRPWAAAAGAAAGEEVGMSTLRTTGGSGSTHLDLLPMFSSTPYLTAALPNSSTPFYSPLDDTANPLAHLTSTHTSASGLLALTYPSAWTGTLEGTTASGSISLKGRDLRTYFHGGASLLGKHVVARKGFGRSRMRFRSGSGSVGVRVGEE